MSFISGILWLRNKFHDITPVIVIRDYCILLSLLLLDFATAGNGQNRFDFFTIKQGRLIIWIADWADIDGNDAYLVANLDKAMEITIEDNCAHQI